MGELAASSRHFDRKYDADLPKSDTRKRPSASNLFPAVHCASMCRSGEMADAVHSKCIAERRGSSSLPSGTTLIQTNWKTNHKAAQTRVRTARTGRLAAREGSDAGV